MSVSWLLGRFQLKCPHCWPMPQANLKILPPRAPRQCTVDETTLPRAWFHPSSPPSRGELPPIPGYLDTWSPAQDVENTNYTLLHMTLTVASHEMVWYICGLPSKFLATIASLHTEHVNTPLRRCRNLQTN